MGRAMRITLIAFLLAALSRAAAADVVTDWNETAVAAGVTARQPTFAHTRSLAMVHLAMLRGAQLDRAAVHAVSSATVGSARHVA